MEHTFNFLRPLTPEPSFNDLLNEFSLTQHGEGVLTRRQARLVETQPPGAVSSNPADPVLRQEPGKNPELERPPQAQPIFGSEIANVVDDDDATSADDDATSADNDATSADDETAPYLKDTLVAQNDVLEAHVIKTHFRRLKNFV